MKARSPLLVIFLTVFIDLIGFGICLPLLPKYATRYGAEGWVIGAVMASYSLMQLIFAPWWGALSDRIGRRPVLLTSTAGALGSYLLFALSARFDGTTGLLVLVISRVFAGICGANLGVAAAAIADVTTPENRSRGMGLIGMAFGLGFVFGPVMGGLAFKHLGLAGPGLVAAGFCAFNLLLAFRILPETRPAHQRESLAKADRWGLIQRTLSRPMVGFLVALYFVATLSFTCFESILPLLLNDLFHLDEEHISYLFAYCGLMGAIIQGGAVRPLVKYFGDENLVWISLFVAAAALLALPFSRSLGLMLGTLALFAGGSGLNRPPTMGLVSRHSPADQQGATMGVVQNAGTLARVVGPMIATSLYHWRPAAPFVFCSVLAATAGVFAMVRLRRPAPTYSPIPSPTPIPPA